MKNILFVINSSQRCGMHQFGKNTSDALSCSSRYQFCLVECASDNTGSIELLNALQKYNPVAVIYHWCPMIMPWLNDDLFRHVDKYIPGLKHLAIVQDHCAPFDWLDAFIHVDPSLTEKKPHYRVGRLIPNYISRNEPTNNIIGSFGFGCKHKNYQKIVEQVNKEFNEAIIRFHIPFNHYGDPKGRQASLLLEECRKLAKPGIIIEANHKFLDKETLLDWLASNTVNCFFFDKCDGRGISSSIDFALAVRRPIAITESHMFRHILKAEPSIIIDDSSLKQIISYGTKPLEPFYQQWTKENLIKDYERIIDEVLMTPRYDLTSNRVLTSEDQLNLRPVIKELTQLSPDIMQRKSPDTVFQNAFIFQQAKSLAKKTDKIIIIGGYEDPIGPALQRLGYQVTITDPKLDKRDMEAVWRESILFEIQYDLVICCSVLEHVEDDVSFIKQMYQILKQGGVAILTIDYRADWEESMPKPSADCRLYSTERLHYLIKQLPPNSILDPPKWGDMEPYFSSESIKYAFCSLAFQKKTEDGFSEKEFVRRYMSELYNHNLNLKIEKIHQLENQLEQFHKLGSINLSIARKLHAVSERYPSIAKFLKKLINCTCKKAAD
jgi:SAM-dependent methyltransferase